MKPGSVPAGDLALLLEAERKVEERLARAREQAGRILAEAEQAASKAAGAAREAAERSERAELDRLGAEAARERAIIQEESDRRLSRYARADPAALAAQALELVIGKVGP